MAALRKKERHIELRAVPGRKARKTVGGMYYADWAEYEKYPVGGMLYGHKQVASASKGGLHYDWVRPRPTLVGGMYYGPTEVVAPVWQGS